MNTLSMLQVSSKRALQEHWHAPECIKTDTKQPDMQQFNIKYFKSFHQKTSDSSHLNHLPGIPQATAPQPLPDLVEALACVAALMSAIMAIILASPAMAPLDSLTGKGESWRGEGRLGSGKAWKSFLGVF